VLWEYSLRGNHEHVVRSGSPEHRAQADGAIREYQRQRDEDLQRLLGPDLARIFLQYAEGHDFSRFIRDLKTDLADQGRELPVPAERALLDLMWTAARETGKNSDSGRTDEEQWRIEYAWQSNVLARAGAFLEPDTIRLLDQQFEQFYAIARMGEKSAGQKESERGHAGKEIAP